MKSKGTRYHKEQFTYALWKVEGCQESGVSEQTYHQ